MEYIIKPLEGVNDIKFGMKQAEVELLIGKPDETINDEIMEEIRETRNNVIFVYIRKRLVDIRFSEDFQYDKNKIFLNDILLYNDESTVAELMNLPKSKPSKPIKNCINFYGLGACFVGYKKSKMKTDCELRFYTKSRIKYYETFLDA